MEIWSASEIRSLLLRHDASGGLRHFFFGTTLLSDDWFADHLQRAIDTAGPRYTPDEPSVETNIRKWVAAFGREASWADAMAAHTTPLRDAEKKLGYALHQPQEKSGHDPTWPDDTLDATRALVLRMQGALDPLSRPSSMAAVEYDSAIAELADVASELRTIEDALVRDIEERRETSSLIIRSIANPEEAESPVVKYARISTSIPTPSQKLSLTCMTEKSRAA